MLDKGKTRQQYAAFTAALLRWTNAARPGHPHRLATETAAADALAEFLRALVFAVT